MSKAILRICISGIAAYSTTADQDVDGIMNSSHLDKLVERFDNITNQFGDDKDFEGETNKASLSVFNELDTNKDGKVSLAEVEAPLSKLGQTGKIDLKQTLAAANSTFTKADQNGDKLLSVPEFDNFMMQFDLVEAKSKDESEDYDEDYDYSFIEEAGEEEGEDADDDAEEAGEDAGEEEVFIEDAGEEQLKNMTGKVVDETKEGSSKAELKLEAAQVAFKVFDTDKDGNVSLDEVLASVKSLAKAGKMDLNQTLASAKTAFAKGDVDSNNLLSAPEFDNFMKQLDMVMEKSKDVDEDYDYDSDDSFIENLGEEDEDAGDDEEAGEDAGEEEVFIEDAGEEQLNNMTGKVVDETKEGSSKAELKLEAAQAAFKVFDTDKDGNVSLDEVLASVKSLAKAGKMDLNQTLASAKTAFTKGDVDANNLLSAPEFDNFMKQLDMVMEKSKDIAEDYDYDSDDSYIENVGEEDEHAGDDDEEAGEESFIEEESEEKHLP